MNYDLWLILLHISSREKIKLINEYENAENVYNNFEKIVKNNKVIRGKS